MDDRYIYSLQFPKLTIVMNQELTFSSVSGDNHCTCETINPARWCKVPPPRGDYSRLSGHNGHLGHVGYGAPATQHNTHQLYIGLFVQKDFFCQVSCFLQRKILKALGVQCTLILRVRCRGEGFSCGAFLPFCEHLYAYVLSCTTVYEYLDSHPFI